MGLEDEKCEALSQSFPVERIRQKARSHPVHFLLIALDEVCCYTFECCFLPTSDILREEAVFPP